MPDILLADIGGTTSRLAFAGRDGRPSRIVTIENDSVAGLESVILRALDGVTPRPRGAVLAVAGPVDGDEIKLTNRDWCVHLRELSTRCGLPRIHAINDFEALAWALPALAAADIAPLGDCTGAGRGVKVVLGPGTGLGVAALVPSGTGWHVVPSEGGHVSFGPASRDEEAVFARLRGERPNLTAETLLSGPGLVRLHAAMHPDHARLKPEAILTQARVGNHEARVTTNMFVRLLGRFAGDVALTFKATGGVYIAGGVALGLGALFDARIFRAAFEAHPPYQALLGTIPTALITYEEPGLLGCGALARRMLLDAEVA
jgi:glucokinase